MKAGYCCYRALGLVLSLKLLPFFILYSRISGRYGRHFEERLGFVRSALKEGPDGPFDLWLHAVSLGEVKVAAAIEESLKVVVPGARSLISTFTEHGRSLAREIFDDRIPIIYAPLDISWAVKKAIKTISPKIMVFLETEIWPAWIVEAHKKNIRIIIANGRISKRSLGKYRLIRPLLKEVFSCMDAFSMISQQDAERIIMLGAPEKRVSVAGNAKYDMLSRAVNPLEQSEMTRILSLSSDIAVIVAGSTRTGEEEMLLNAFAGINKGLFSSLLILAPRHIARTGSVVTAIRAHGFECQLWSDIKSGREKRTKQVVVVDTFGDLFRLYSVANIAFCGGSLVRLGGQNPLEPAAWGKPVFHGPSMEDFEDAISLLRRWGGSVEVPSPGLLTEQILWYLNRPEEMRKMGDAASRAVLSHKGAARRHAEVIAAALSK